MNTKTTATTRETNMLTTADLDEMTRDDRWLGYGYLGERRNLLAGGDPEAPARPELVAEMDTAVLEAATTRGLTRDELFHWANSKDGRWYADSFGTRHAATYAPTARQAQLAAEQA